MESTSSLQLIARKKERDIVLAAVQAAQNKAGTLLCIRAESGYGKSTLLESVLLEQRNKQQVDVVRIECQPPIGSMNVSSIQPMQPWVKSLETLVELNAGSAKKRLVLNIGLSVLGLIPIAGSIFDMTKEIMRDLREYRADNRSNKDVESAGDKLFAEFFDALTNLSLQRPFVMMLDDAQWMDAQSVEFLNYLTKRAKKIPFSVILSFQQATAEVKNPALASWFQEQRGNHDISFLELQAFNADEISECVRAHFPRQSVNTMFNEWMMRRTAGIPITVCEYLRYFQRNSPFRDDGSLDADRLASQAIPASLQALFAKNIENLSESDINTLSLCSSEGREFTVFIIAQLLNVDTLSAVKKLKSLQYRTGIIRSTGAHARYGLRTTVYEFTQALHHTYFHSTLEHEERVELHDRIASILRRCFEETKDEILQRQLAPYIAAHALEAGDEVTAKSMLVESAHAAEDSGSVQIVRDIVTSFQEMDERDEEKSTRKERDELQNIAASMGLVEPPTDSHIKPITPESSQADVPDCNIVRDDILDMYFAGDFDQAATRAQEFLSSSSHLIQPIDVIMLYAMASRCEIENGRLTVASDYLQKAQEQLQTHSDDYARCLVDNLASIIALRSGNLAQGLHFLQLAARSSSLVTDDMKLLTMTNISLALRSSNPRQSRLFERVAKQLCSSLRFQEFGAKVFE